PAEKKQSDRVGAMARLSGGVVVGDRRLKFQPTRSTDSTNDGTPGKARLANKRQDDALAAVGRNGSGVSTKTGMDLAQKGAAADARKADAKAQAVVDEQLAKATGADAATRNALGRVL